MVPLQETFNTVVSHLRKQGKKALSLKDGACRYRLETEDGVLQCAAGCLIPSNKYSESFEGTILFNCRDELSLVGKCIQELGHNPTLVRVLQTCHDEVPVDLWENRFKEIAKVFNLTYYLPLTNPIGGV